MEKVEICLDSMGIGEVDKSLIRVMATVDFRITKLHNESPAHFAERCGKVFAGRIESFLTAKKIGG